MAISVDLKNDVLNIQADDSGRVLLQHLVSSNGGCESCLDGDSYQAAPQVSFQADEKKGFWNLFPLLFAFSINNNDGRIASLPEEDRLRRNMTLLIDAMEKTEGGQKLFSRLQAAILQVHLAGMIYHRILKTVMNFALADIDHSLDDANGLIIRAEALADIAGLLRGAFPETSEAELKWYELRFAEVLTRINIFMANVTHTPDAYYRAVSLLRTLIENLLESDDPKEHRLAKLIFDANRERFDGVFRQKIMLLVRDLNVQTRKKGAFRVMSLGLPVLMPKIPMIENKYCDELHIKLRLAFLNNSRTFMYDMLRLRDGVNEVERHFLRRTERR